METDRRQPLSGISNILVLALLLIAAGSVVYASVNCRGLYQDGAYYLYRVAERDGFYLFDPARTTSQVLRQAPIAFLSKFSDLSLQARGQIFSLTMLGLPILFCAVCWLIAPSGRKGWALFPLLHLLIGVSATSFNAVGENLIAAGYYWVLLFLLLFRTRDYVSQGLYLLLCIPAFFLQEGAFLLMLVLFAACIVRSLSADSLAERSFLLTSALILLLIIAYEMRWVINPRIPGGREVAFHALIHLEFLYRDGRLNLPVVTGTLAFLALAAIVLLHWRMDAATATSRSRWVAIGFVAAAIGAMIAAWQVEWTFAPVPQILARYHPVYVGTALGLAAIILMQRNIPDRYWLNPATLVIVATLGIAQTASDVVATSRWQAYINDLSARLAQSRGLIAWEDALTTGDPRRDLDWKLMSADWVMPMMSVVFSRDGMVSSIVDLPKNMTFRPFDPAKPETLPRFRGVYYGPYLEALSRQQRTTGQ